MRAPSCGPPASSVRRLPLLALLGLLAGCDGNPISGSPSPMGPGTSGGECSDKYPLVASAGTDRSVDKNTWVTLDGTGSRDPNGNGSLDYQWAISSPSGAQVNPSGATSSTPGFVASQSGVYRGTLVVSSACDSSDPDTVSITVVNTAPVADAGLDQRVRKRVTVQLSGSKSSDADRDTLTYAWRIHSAPAGSTAQLADASSVSPTLLSEVAGVYQLALVVHDGEVASAADLVEVTLYNTAPVAQAGADQESVVGSLVTLGASGTDADGDALTYRWTLTSPQGSNASLTGETTAAPTFTPDVEGDYALDLVAHDGTDPSPADRVVVTVHRPIQPLAYKVVDAEYSRSLERVVMVSATPHALHVYDPATQSDVAVTLERAPTCVSVSPDGKFAVVGHDAYISYVNLETPAVVGVPTLVSVTVGDVALSATHAYAIAGGTSGFSPIYAVNLSTRAVTSSSDTLYSGARLKLHAGGTALYVVDTFDLSKFTLGTSRPQWAYDWDFNYSYELHDNIWLSEDGAHLFAASGRAFTTGGTTSATDLRYAGTLAGYATDSYSSARAQAMDHESTTNTLAVIRANEGYYGDQTLDTKLQLFTGALALEATVALPRFVLSSKGHAGHGRFVFHSANGSRRFVILQADATAVTAGLAQEYGLVAY